MVGAKEGTATVVSNVRGRSILGTGDNKVNMGTGIDKKSISDHSTVRISGTLQVIQGVSG